MVRRRVEAGTVDNNEISCPRRTSTPEIVRIRTTEATNADVTASTREDTASGAAVHGSSESNKTSSGQSASTVDVVRHGMLGGSRNSEILVRKGCDQDEARHRPTSGAEVVRYKVEQHQLPSATSSGSLEKKSLAKQNPNSTTQSEKDKKQQMPLRHQVS